MKRQIANITLGIGVEILYALGIMCAGLVIVLAARLIFR
jgi:hypothetical protein